MADGKALKLAAARKKLKEFQDKSKNLSTAKALSNEALNNKEKPAIPNANIPQTQTKDIVDHNRDMEQSQAQDLTTTKSLSPSESLRQISMQLNGLVSQTHDFSNGITSSEDLNTLTLEKRNQELASSLKSQTQHNEQLNHQLQDLKAQITKLQQQMEKERKEFDERLFREQSSLREQLQVHIQTIGILVAEKTELQSSLSQCQQTAKQRAGEVEELQGRLKASRQRVSDLERELTTTTVSSKQFEENNKHNSKEIDRLKMDIYKTTKSNEELEQKNSELLSKLNVKITECQSQEERIEDLQHKFTMAELRIKQLSVDNSEDSLNQLEALQQEKMDLLQKEAQLKASIEKITDDRDRVSENYQQFAKQLNQQIHGLTQETVSLKDENETLKQHTSGLEAQVEKLKVELEEQKKGMSQSNNKNVVALEEQIKELEKKQIEMQQLYQSQIADNSQLSHFLEERESRIQELEKLISDLQNVKVDKEKLLEVMQSDKVAASRAMAQNKELKKQLEELQNGFVKLSNDKLHLTESVQEEQHISKELGERLSQQEEELNELREQLEDKEKQLSLLQQNSNEVTKQMYQQHQIADRIRHFEAKGQLTEMLQQELNQAQERINGLTSQNSELRTLLANQAERLLSYKENDGDNNDLDSLRKDEMVVSLSASVRQLELERNQLLKQLDDQQQQHESLKNQLKEMHDDNSNCSDIALNDETGDNNTTMTVSVAEYRNLKQAMIKLESRFTKTMNDIAQLSDEKQQLEYLVMQLQGETETIGDYIALYQTQRTVMKQQVMKKDEYIATISRDQEELKRKLAELQELVYKLLFEKQQMQGLAALNSKLPGKAQLARPDDGDKTFNADLSNLLEDITNASTSLDATTEVTNHTKDVAENGKPVEPSTNPTRTARKIIDLISEIGSTSLMEKTISDNFHPCPVCSGRLMTV